MSYFDNWGSIQNPIRQSDLNALFGSSFRCPKKFAIAKEYTAENPRINYKQALGIIIHDIFARKIRFNKYPHLVQMISIYEKQHRIINWYDKDKDSIIEQYKLMMKAFENSKELKAILQRKLEVERSFIVKIGDHYIAGTVDLIIQGKSENAITIIDWKTGHPPMSQFEMDNGYQTRIYIEAVKNGEFFLKPDDMTSGEAYYKAYQSTMEKNTFKEFLEIQMMYAYPQDLLPVKRKSKRQCKHYSSEKMSNNIGIIHLESGDRWGPMYYETKPKFKNLNRLIYTINCAVAMAGSGLFPESFGINCEDCFYIDKCESLGGKSFGMKQQALQLMENLGIEGV